MVDNEKIKETLQDELSLLAYDYMMYKLGEYSTSQLRNLYQERLYSDEMEICRCIKSIIHERDCHL